MNFICRILCFLVFLSSCAAAQKSAGADNRYVATDGSWIGPRYDGPAELPRQGFYTGMSATPSPGITRTVCISGCQYNTLAAAYAAAVCGDTITMKHGEVFEVSDNTLLNKKCDAAHWITIRTDVLGQLPPEGTRLTPCSAGVRHAHLMDSPIPGMPIYACPANQTSAMPKLVKTAYGNGGVGPIEICGASYHRLIGLELTRARYKGNVVMQIVNVTESNHIILDRLWAHGDQYQDAKNIVSVRGTLYFAVLDSWLMDAHCETKFGICTEGHGIGGGHSLDAQGNWKIVNNLISGGGEDILFGGSPCGLNSACVDVYDLEIRRNHFYKNPLWRSGNPNQIRGLSGGNFIVKNVLELKTGNRVLLEGNIYDGAWRQGDQFGWALLLGNRNGQSVTDVTSRYEWAKNTSAGMMLASINCCGENKTSGGWRWSIHDWIMESITSSEAFGSSMVFQYGSSTTITQQHSVYIDHMTVFVNPAKQMIVMAFPGYNAALLPYDMHFTNSILQASQYTLHGTAACASNDHPKVTFDRCWRDAKGPNYLVTRNVILNLKSSDPWPTGNFYWPLIPLSSVGFVNANNGMGGDYHLLPSSPYKKAGTDGKDLGADVDRVIAETSGVDN